MINILSYIGMNLQSEVCLWTLLGLLLTIFDATLFKVNANLKQVWQMVMPPELSLHVQRVLRTMISGVMLVQCFTVYVYLASYIVLLYPVFLEERPTLVLPWLLLAAIRNFLCELTSLALGLGTCVLLGPARPPCIKFLIIKLASIMPSFYMWMLIFSYYHNLKLASTFKTFPAVSPVNNLDYGLELAIRRRRTKSLLGEDQLRKKLIASLYHENLVTVKEVVSPNLQTVDESDKKSVNSNNEEAKSSSDIAYPFAVTANRTTSDIGTFEDWVGSEVVLPRVADRILEQFVLMLLRIGAFLNKDEADVRNILSANSQAFLPPKCNRQECPGIPTEETETPPFVGNSKGRIQSYLLDYPQIFLRKPSDILGSHNINEHKFRETNLFDNKESPLELSRAHTSDSVKTISLDNVSLSRRDKEFFEDRKDLIHSDQDLYKSAPSSSKKHIEFLNGSTTICERTESSVNVSSSDDINRMKYPADLSLDRQKNERSLLTEHSSKKEISLPKSNVERKSNTNIKIESDDQLLSQDKNQKDK